MHHHNHSIFNHSIFGFVPRFSRLAPAVAAVLALVPAALSERPDILWMAGGHTAAVNCVAFSPDGQTLASGSGDDTIKLWRVSDGALLRTLTGQGDDVLCLAFSHDGWLLASGSGHWRQFWYLDLILWRVSDGAKLWHLQDWDKGIVRGVVFSLDDQTLALAMAHYYRGMRWGWVALRRVSDGALLGDMGHEDVVNCVALSPDGQMVAAGGGETGQPNADFSIWLWRLSDGALLRKLTGHTGGVNSVAFSPDGQTLASGSDDKTIRLWRVSDGALLRTLTGHTWGVTSVAFSPDGRTLMSGSSDGWPYYQGGEIKLWRVSDGALLKTYDEETDRGVLSVQVSPDGQLFAYGRRDAFVVVARYPSLLPCPGDLDGDGEVDQADLAILLADWGCTGEDRDCPGDVDGDGDTDQADLAELLAAFGRICW